MLFDRLLRVLNSMLPAATCVHHSASTTLWRLESPLIAHAPSLEPEVPVRFRVM
jgi:hypothetical protein